MRYFLFLASFLFAGFSFAQTKQVEQSQSSKNMVAQQSYKADCFLGKYDAGQSAMRRGDYKAAARFFEEAKSCPDAMSSSRRINDLESLIEFCNNKIGGNKSAAAEVSKTTARASSEDLAVTGRKFAMSAKLRNNTDPNCFKLTVSEAERAFRDSCWDDAAKLFRAAKTCFDANQTDRERMNVKIEACRAAAEDELLQKEQKAVRTARHAIAANLADDAMDFLRLGNRSLAFRLADFANFYIAPDDNPDCMESMYAASLYSPSSAENAIVKPPFVYQLAEDPGNNAVLRFAEFKKEQLLYAYFPHNRQLAVWSLPAMKLIQSYMVPSLKSATGFDISPQGEVLFYGDDFFFLPDQQLIEVSSRGQYCFSEDGRTFFYEDIPNSVVRSVQMSSGYQEQTKKGALSSRNTYIQETVIPTGGNLMALKSFQGNLWLGYPDRIVVVSRNSKTAKMGPVNVWMFPNFNGETANRMHLVPERREMLFSTDTATHYFFLHLDASGADTILVSPLNHMKGTLADATHSPDTLLAIKLQHRDGEFEGEYTIYNPEQQQIIHRFYGGNLYGVMNTALSTNGEWLATLENGLVLLWSLKDYHIKPPAQYETSYNDWLSSDGNRLVVNTGQNLRIYDTNRMRRGNFETLENFTESPLPAGESRYWVAYWSNPNQMSIRHFNSGKKLSFEAEKNVNFNFFAGAYAFDAAEDKYFAFSGDNGTVQVQSLETGQKIASRSFSGVVTQLRFVPGTDKLVVVIRSFQSNRDQYTVKIWDTRSPDETPKSIRLNNYFIALVAMSEQSNRIAFSDMTDIHIFSLDNLENELIVLRPSGAINHMAFRPDGLALAGGCEGGSVFIWDALSGQRILKFANTWNGENYSTTRLAFSDDGKNLRINSPGYVFNVGLDPEALRESLQSGERWLNAFSTSQIREFQLETAFRYPGNFDRLAQSNDFPLIRSFFEYFREQSINSNNIQQVRTYCERAFTLYQLLEGVHSTENLKATMLAMYDDYVLKCLLRNDTKTATEIVAQLNNYFDKPAMAVLNAAHTSLFNQKLDGARKLYTDYLVKTYTDDNFEYNLTEIKSRLFQFKDADMLDSSQARCICSVFRPFAVFESLCPVYQPFDEDAYAAQAPIYNAVYWSIVNSTIILSMLDKERHLEETHRMAAGLPYPNPVVDIHPLELSVIALADFYLNRAEFEQNGLVAPVYFNKAISLLEKTGVFKNAPDTARLDRLANAYFSLGTYTMLLNKPAEAAQQFSACVQAAQQLLSTATDDTQESLLSRTSNLLNRAYQELGYARLLEGKAAEARRAFDQVVSNQNVGKSEVGLGHLALLEADDVTAFIEYGGSVRTAEQLGNALFFMNQMAEQLPAHRDRINQFIPTFRTAYFNNHPEMLVQEMEYWLSSRQKEQSAAQQQWEPALNAVVRAKEATQTMLSRSSEQAFWRVSYIGELTNQTYFLLIARHRDTSVLSEIIQLAEEGLRFVYTENTDEFFNSLFLSTNLAHAWWIRNQGDDRVAAIEQYKQFLTYYTWEYLKKDFIDLRRAGLIIPDLKQLVEAIKPTEINLSTVEWQQMLGN